MNKSAIILLFIANAISGVAQGMSMIAIPWFFAQKSSLALFGTIYLVTNVLSMIWVPISGTIVDRFDRKKIFLVLTSLIGCVIVGFAALGFHLGELPLYLVGTVFVITFLNYNIHYPCLYAFVQEITEPKNYSKMTSLLEIVGQITTISAGAGATLLLEGTSNGVLTIFGFSLDVGFEVAPWQIHEIFLLDGFTYFLSFTIISFISYKSLTRRKPETGGVIERIKTGLNYLNGNRSILWFGVLSFIVFTAMLMEAFYLGVSYVSNQLQESGDVYANSKMAYSTGAIILGLTISYILKKVNIPFLISFLTVVMAAIFLTLSFSNSLLLFFVMMFLIGITNAGTRVARITFLFRKVPNQYFGRAGSIFFIVNVVIRIILLIVFAQAFFQEGNNIVIAYRITGVILLISGALLVLKYKEFKNIPELTAS